MAEKRVDSLLDIGKIVRAQRHKLNFRQAEAAGLIGVGVRFLSELERGKETLAAGKVLQVLKALGLNVSVGTTSEETLGEK
jgi:transcriptional regulator with XRE-family HTH domain